VPALSQRLSAISASLNLQALSVAEGLRAALSVAVIIALNEYFHWPPLIWSALSAFNVCMCDPGGQIRRRMPVLLTITVLTVLIVGLGGPVRAGGIGAWDSHSGSVSGETKGLRQRATARVFEPQMCAVSADKG
jgi:hypothetical protein